MWTLLHLEPLVSGCPNRCRHCSENAGPPFGAFMSLEDVQWIAEKFRRVVGEHSAVRVWVEMMEVTTHPDFLQLLQFSRSTFTEEWRMGATLLSSNGYGLARSENPAVLWESLHVLGLHGFGTAICGLEVKHDQYTRRKGSYQDVARATQDALASSSTVQHEIHVDRWTLPEFAEIVREWERIGEGRIRLLAGIPCFYMNARLRAFEELRPTKAEVEAQAEAIHAVAPEGVGKTEAEWTRQLAKLEDTGALLETYQRGGVGPEERDLGWFRITPQFEVIEWFFARPSIAHGNLKRDGIERVWQHVLEAEVPTLPEPQELAQRYGDFTSEAMHPTLAGVYVLLCDRYWQEQR